MNAIVCYTLAIRIPLINPQLMMQIASFRTESHMVNDCRRTAESCRYRSRTEIIYSSYTNINIEVCMHINTARQYNQPSRVDDLSALRI